MSNRVEEVTCILCNFPLIEPNEWSCCEGCKPKLIESVEKAKKLKGPRSPRRVVIHNRAATKWLRDKRK